MIDGVFMRGILHLHEIRELGVPEGDVRRLGGERRKHVRKAAQRLVDALGLAQPLRVATYSRAVDALASRQVDEMKHTLGVVEQSFGAREV